jgi:hypothetical protein
LAAQVCCDEDGRPFSRESRETRNKGRLIKADAGSGKTWMMQQLALAMCKVEWNIYVIFLPLSAHALACFSCRNPSFSSFLLLPQCIGVSPSPPSSSCRNTLPFHLPPIDGEFGVHPTADASSEPYKSFEQR